jgi:uncharacterized radical SAM superfamily Fe-S cluster-containing enzyme
MTLFPFFHRYPPAPPPVHTVCPHCKRKVHRYVFTAQEVVIATHHCAEHGDVIAIPSAVCNPEVAA